MYGLGDSLYMRAVIAERIKQIPADVLRVMTPWPQLWADLPLTKTPSGTSLRMQRLNEAANMHMYDGLPSTSVYRRRIYVGYAGHDFKNKRSMLDKIADHLSVTLPDEMSLGWSVPEEWKCRPEHESADINARPVAFVRPPTIRNEWQAPGRNPDQSAFVACVNRLMQTHHVVSVAAIEQGKESAISIIPAHTRLEAGQLNFEQLLGMLAASDIALGGVGWLLPAMLATETRALILAGGVLAANGPHATMPRQFDWSRVKMTLPDDGEQCWCSNYRHNCRRKTDPARTVADLESVLNQPKELAAA